MSPGMHSCPVCESAFRLGRPPWLLRCAECGFRASTLAEQIASPHAHEIIDEHTRSGALSHLRERNFRAILRVLGRLRERRGRLLDVGCAHGWFLRAAHADRWQVVGIEPDLEMARVAAEAGNDVRPGVFPAALSRNEKFDAITFHDVFEHLPDVNAALVSCREALVRRGLLVINLPDARGPFFRLALALASFGIHRPLERLWQKNFPSPHLSYFTAPLLRRLALKHGFHPVYGARLPSVALRGLWSRLRYDRTAGVFGSAVVFLGVCLLLPMLRLL